MILPRDSIRARLIGLAALLTGVALVAGYLAIAAILEDFITGRFDAETEAVADALIAGATIGADGRLAAGPAPADPRFEMPLSGWFWQLTQDGQVVAKSPSLFDNVLNPPEADFQGGPGLGPAGEPLRVARHAFTLPDSASALAVTVTAPRAEIDAAMARLRRPLAVSLAVLGLALALASLLQVAAGLRSLDRLGRDLRDIRAGRAEALPLPGVAELRPVAAEINGLLEQNRAVLARSREHVGNLAHSLKTPLAALDNALPADHPGHALIARMDRQIGWHLRRARSSAAPRLLGQHTPVVPVIRDILLVLGGPIREAGLQVEIRAEADPAFAGERQDLEEMIGNLVENAVKWASRRVRITALSEGERLRLLIEDDGPGMSDADHARALTRGARLDEAGPPGSGLGLAIVADLAALHGGRLALERSALGGLCAALCLPGIPALPKGAR
ncbi:HAMP domain-containing sensor histidine kinase [Paracoccus sp. PS-1]|uniref:sensor histidine kinase n=1 Tax=unclassified Paracoccus (in: a-proteobacteria) TaxID=2688777 RepID=UPI00048AD68A|nr:MULTISPECIES: HAMP domain-containing sensor histidine kinase [unclassified Paracoccus (in: a-proteobacteria)]MDQ7261649.1 HAMP domain-containing sensor histidine kinase [Paracoccus sp. PS1]